MTRKYMEAYLVGLICGDGHIEPNSNRVIIFSSDKGFLETIRGFIIQYYDNKGSLFYDKAAKEWKLAVNSKGLKDTLTTTYRVPAGNKANQMTPPKITGIQKTRFLEGLFDAEGWYELDKNKYYRIKIKMKNKAFITFTHNILKEQKIYSLFYDKGNNTYSVEINKQDQVKKFLSTFNLHHPKWLLLRSTLNF